MKTKTTTSFEALHTFLKKLLDITKSCILAFNRWGWFFMNNKVRVQIFYKMLDFSNFRISQPGILKLLRLFW